LLDIFGLLFGFLLPVSSFFRLFFCRIYDFRRSLACPFLPLGWNRQWGVFHGRERGGDSDIAVEEGTGDGVESVDFEVTGNGRVTLASLARQDDIAGGKDVGMIDVDDECDGAAAPLSCISALLQTIDASLLFGGRQDQNLPRLVVWVSFR
jgi:hypothetical protein